MNYSTIYAGFDTLIGWRQNDDPNGLQLTNLLTSTSGLFYNDIHPTLTTQNLASICPDYITTIPSEGDRNAAFELWLKNKTRNGIIEMINEWNAEKAIFGTGVNLLHSKRLFNTAQSISKLDTITETIVGIELRPKRSKSLLLKIKQIGLHFTGSQPVNIRVYQSGKTTFLYEEDLSCTGGLQWFPVDWELKATENYYIVYNSTDYEEQPVNGVYNYSAIDNGRLSFPTGRFFQATSFDAGVKTSENLWDIKNNVYTLSTNHGINLDITVECDFSDFVVEQSSIFLEAARLKVGMNMMREIAFNANARINRNESNLDARMILNEIDGDTQGNNSMSVYGRYRTALKNIMFDESQIDKVCLPCKDDGIKYDAVGSISNRNSNEY